MAPEARPADQQGRIAVLLKGYPRLSETFIAQELRGLEQAGLRLVLYSMRQPTDREIHPVHREIEAPVHYLPEYLHRALFRVLRAWYRQRRRPGYAEALALFRKDLAWDFSRNRFRRFGQALVLADELGSDVVHLHSHFLHTPASVAFYASRITGHNWTCSAHAKDIWTSPEKDLIAKLADATWVVTCTRTGHAHLQKLASEPARVHLSYHGLNLARFASPGARPPGGDGSNPDQPVQLLSVCRAVEKKGLDNLLEALALLPEDLHWRFSHIGGGVLSQTLRAQADRLNLSGRIDWLGATAQEKVLERLRSSDLFVLPCRVAADGDRDGLPNVLVEAQSQRLACVSTNVSGVPELIEDGVNGALLKPDDPAALARVLARLIKAPETRAAMGERGEKRVRGAFSHEVSVAFLKRLFQGVLGQGAPARPGDKAA